MNQASKNNWKFIASIPKYIAKNVWDSSTQNLKSFWQLAKNVVSSAGDLLSLVEDAADLDVIGAINEIGDIIDNTDIVKISYDNIKNNLKHLRDNSKELVQEWKDIRRSNLALEKEEKEKENNKMGKKTGKRNPTGNPGGGQGTTGKNHPEWYLQDKSMVKELVGINIATRLNAQLDRLTSVQISDAMRNTPVGARLGLASVASMQLLLTIPKSITEDWNQGINMLYKNIRAANAGAINYSPGQLGNYVLNVRTIDAALSTMARAIKSLNSINFYDALSPQALFAAYGLDYDSFAENAANLRELYNRLATIRYRLMPLNVTLLDRTRWLFSNIFTDSNDAKAQIYVPITTRVPYFPVTGKVGEREDVKEFTICAQILSATQTGLLFDDFKSQIISLFNSYQTDEVAQIIAGDIIKAYGKQSLNKYPDIPSNQEIKPCYDQWILTQFQNASLAFDKEMRPTYDNNSSDFASMQLVDPVPVSTSNGVLRYTPHYDKYTVHPTYNSNVDVVDTGKLLSSTRLMVSRHGEFDAEEETGKIVYDTYGTEVPVDINVYNYNEASSNIYKLLASNITFIIPMTKINTDGTVNDVTMFPSIWSWFDYFPVVLPATVINANDDTTIEVFYRPIMLDFNNFGIAYKDNLDSYNAIATLSMIHKPFISRVNKTEVIGD